MTDFHLPTSRVRGMVAVFLLLCAAPAEAGNQDISIRGLGRPRDHDPSDPAVKRYRDLANELAAVLAPRALAPAETLGVNGFEISFGVGLSPIPHKGDQWRGQPGTPVFEGAARGFGVPQILVTPTVQVRKGLPFSTEIGVTGVVLADSSVFVLGTDLKVALYESYVRWVPALAVRLNAGRMFGAEDLDLITAEGDLMLSLPFAIGGMVQVTPYLGAGMLFVQANSLVIDETPYLVTNPDEQRGGDAGSLYSFPTLDLLDNQRPRGFVGVRVISAFVEVLYEVTLTQLEAGDVMHGHSLKLGFDM